MRKIFAYSLIALGAVLTTPVMAQGIYVGPDGVGVDTGIRHGYSYDRDDRRRYRDDTYEGRSAYRDGYRYDRHHEDED